MPPLTSLLLTYELWGTTAVIIGLVLLGIGIVPVALLAALFHGQWWHLLDLVVLILTTFGTRLLAGWLSEKANADLYAQVGSQSDDRRSKGTGKLDHAAEHLRRLGGINLRLWSLVASKCEP